MKSPSRSPPILTLHNSNTNLAQVSEAASTSNELGELGRRSCGVVRD
jgi:hypothetical protein